MGDGAGAKRRTVLLVDADPSLRTIANLHLGADVELLEVPDERAALDLMARQDVDVAVCAFTGTHVDAAECLRLLRGHPDPRVARTPVLLLADRDGAGLTPLVEELGPAVALEPPVTGPKLAAAVRTLTGA